jgi:hypothetical protein
MSIEDQLTDEPTGQAETGRRRMQLRLAPGVVVRDQKELVGGEHTSSRAGRPE